MQGDEECLKNNRRRMCHKRFISLVCMSSYIFFLLLPSTKHLKNILVKLNFLFHFILLNFLIQSYKFISHFIIHEFKN